MFYQTTLPNKAKVLIAPTNSTKAATLLVMFKVGSRYENKSKNGLAHFTEHMMFKGTKRRPTTLHIAKELDAIGADYNAFTSKEYTGYYIKAEASHLQLAADVLSDMLFNSQFNPAEIERERKVIIEEINMYEDMPMALIEDVFDSLAYHGNSLAWDVIGSKQTVSNVQRSDFVGFTNKFYQPSNMFISIAGAVEPGTVEAVMKKFFSKQNKPVKSNSFRPVKIRQRRPQIHLKAKETEQVHLALGFVGSIGYQSNLLLPLQIANIALGGNMSSRLFIAIREREGLCYYIRSRVNTYQDVGNWTVYSGLDVSRLDLAVKLIVSELRRFRKQGITKKELENAKEYLKGKIVLRLEDSANLAQWFAEYAMFKRKVLTPTEVIKKIDKIDLSTVNRAIERVMKESRLNLAIIGPDRPVDKLSKFLKFN